MNGDCTKSASTCRKTDIKPLGISVERVRELFELRGGELFWKVNAKAAKIGDLAGGLTANGYWRITIGGRSYKRARLIWLHVHGADSCPLFIDHINRVRSDDRIENLRLVTNSENQRNRSWGISKSRYVYFDDGRWRARVGVRGRRISLGRFASEEEAIAAVREWEAANG